MLKYPQDLSARGTCAKRGRCVCSIPPNCIGMKSLPSRTQSLRCPPGLPTQRQLKRTLVVVSTSKNNSDDNINLNNENDGEERNTQAPPSKFTLKRRSVGGPALSVSSSTTGPSGKEFAPVSRQGPVKDSTSGSEELKDHIMVAVLLAMWYAGNIGYNLLHKQVMNVFPFATTCTFVHLATASLVMLAVWALGLQRLPSLERRVLNKVAPLAMFHVLGFWATNMALAAVSVSLVHTTMTLEPVFAVMMSVALFKSTPSFVAAAALVPILVGVATACSVESSFTWFGFAAALAANLAFQFRNMYSRRFMVENSLDCFEAGGNYIGLDEVNLFACITLASTMLMVPIVLLVDGTSLMAKLESGIRIISGQALGKTVLAGVCRAVDVLASYALLTRVNPFTHSLSNCVRRIGVIGASLVVFNIPLSAQSLSGIGLAVVGMLAYSLANRTEKMSQLGRIALLQPAPGGSISVEKLMTYVAPYQLRNALDEFGWTYDSPTVKRKDEGDMPPQPETYNL